MNTDIVSRCSRALMIVVAGMLASSLALAANPDPAARQMVQEVTSNIIDEIVARGDELQSDRQAVYELVERLVLPHFDFERMSRRVLGKKQWNMASSGQRTRFIRAFRTLLVHTYALVLNEYRGQTLSYLDPVSRKRENEVVVPVKIALSANQSIQVAYAMYGSGADWKVFDVAVDGVSLVTNYRSSFRSEIARHGIEGLIARLEVKNSGAN